MKTPASKKQVSACAKHFLLYSDQGQIQKSSLNFNDFFFFFWWHSIKTGKWITGFGHCYLWGGTKEILLPSVFSLQFIIRKK